MNTDTEILSMPIKFAILRLCNISQIATGVPYSESLRTIFGPILVNIRRNLTDFQPVCNTCF
jgi:hypothetical protein